MIYDMEQFMVQCVETYLTAANETRDSLKYAATQFLEGDKLVETDDAVKAGALRTAYRFQRSNEVLHGARMARFDLLKAVANLAKNVTKWNANCDKRVHRLICYVHKLFIRFAAEGSHRRLL